MSEEQVAVVEQVVQTEQVEQVEDHSDATESIEVESNDSEDEDKAEKKANKAAKKSGFEKRIQRLNNKVDTAAAEAAHWRAVAQQHQQSQQASSYQGQAAEQDPVEAAVERKLAARDQAASQAATMQTYNSRAAEFAKTNADFAQILKETDDVPCASEVHQICLESEVGPAIAYHLAKNVDELERINALSPHRRMIELGKLEDKLINKQTKTPKEVKPVPKPITQTVGKAPSSVGDKSIYEMSPQELMAFRNKTRGRGR